MARDLPGGASLWLVETAGVGPVTEQDYGLREFVLTDPDGNRVRSGSPIG